MIVTIVIALASGNLFGWICKNQLFSPPEILFKDDDHFVNVYDRYNDENKALKDDDNIAGLPTSVNEVEMK